MPRDINGNFTLDPSNPVVPGTVIETGWANPSLSDIANALTDSLSRTGSGGMLAPFKFADGTKTSPGESWANEPTSGWYRAASHDFRFAMLGVDVLQTTVNGLTVPGSVVSPLVQGSGGALTLQAVTGAINLNAGGQVVRPINDNTDAFGDAAHRWSSGYFGTSVVSPLLKSPTGAALTLGTTDLGTLWTINNATGGLSPSTNGTIPLGSPSNRISAAYFANAIGLGSTGGGASFSATTTLNTGSHYLSYTADSAGVPKTAILGVDGPTQLGFVGTLTNHLLQIRTNNIEAVRVLVGAGPNVITIAPSATDPTIGASAGNIAFSAPVKFNAGLTPAFESAEQTITLGTHTFFAHGLAFIPKNVQAIIRCKTAEGGYGVGDEVSTPAFYAQSSVYYNVCVYANATNVGFIVGTGFIEIANRLAVVGQTFRITLANWKLVLRAW